jgi:dTDP-4-dehydrorhamnose 3,5-epimerase
MIFKETKLKGAFIIEMEPIGDNRGFFARAWCQREFEAHGLISSFVQANVTFSPKRGTLRGLHYQIAPHEEVKLVRCTQGAIYDVIIDLRPESPTYEQWLGTELTADNRKMIYIPGGFAHGYQILMNDTEVFYQVGQFYAPEHERGIRWNDPAFEINWPIASPLILSKKDKRWPDYPL